MAFIAMALSSRVLLAFIVLAAVFTLGIFVGRNMDAARAASRVAGPDIVSSSAGLGADSASLTARSGRLSESRVETPHANAKRSDQPVLQEAKLDSPVDISGLKPAVVIQQLVTADPLNTHRDCGFKGFLMLIGKGLDLEGNLTPDVTPCAADVLMHGK